MKTRPHEFFGTLISLSSLTTGDVILVRRYISSKKIPFWPFKITSLIPEMNGNSFLVLAGEFLTPEGPVQPAATSPAGRVIFVDGEQYMVGKPMPASWVKNELQKAEEEMEHLQKKINWLQGLK